MKSKTTICNLASLTCSVKVSTLKQEDTSEEH